MRFSRWVAAVFAIAACAAVAFAGSGGAAAALLTSTAYPHSQTLVGGTVSVTVTNSWNGTATCWVSIHAAEDLGWLALRAAQVNTGLSQGVVSAELDNARQQVAGNALHKVLDGVTIAQSASTTETWDSGREETSYAIYQECTTPHSAFGVIDGLAQSYLVSGTGTPANGPGDDDGHGGNDSPGGNDGPGENSGNGSLGALF